MENITIEELKKLIHTETSTGKTVSKIIALGTTIMTGCAMIIISFIWDLKSKVPLLEQAQTQTSAQFSTLQGSVNSIRMDQGTQKENQARIEEHVKNIEAKLESLNNK